METAGERKSVTSKYRPAAAAHIYSYIYFSKALSQIVFHGRQ